MSEQKLEFYLSQFVSQLAHFSQPNTLNLLTGIRHGVERETLRINPNGQVANSVHPIALGSALCNDFITTDYAEVLMEFITQPHESIDDVLTQLTNIQQFTASHLGEELLWPTSMPCYVANIDEVQLAQYGSSNIGRLKTLYREGLRNRYGSMMQLIAGVHFNFSMSDVFWLDWHKASTSRLSLMDFRSEKYMGLLRNFKRLVWMIPYLFGASPALCSSFLQGKETHLPFKKLGMGTIYLPYATSLRMSDLGYTNSDQSALSVSYDSLPEYVAGLRKAINTPSKKYADIGVKSNGVYKQLNANVLQIENEFYSPIRPKQVAHSGEKPTDALESRGINYIEVRALDVNPFEVNGISKNYFYFLDSFLLYCLLNDSPNLTEQDQDEADSNLDKIVLEGRKPGLELISKGSNVDCINWMTEVFLDIQKTASLLDSAYQTNEYSQAVLNEQAKIENPDLTPSALLLNHLLENNLDNGKYALELAKKYKQQLLASELDESIVQTYQQQAKQSLAAQKDIEAADTLSFDDFLADYVR